MNTNRFKLKRIGVGNIMFLSALLSMPVSADITGTVHNLSSTSTVGASFSGTGQICVFCHTPHGSDTSASAPLWNRDITTPPAYTTYNSLGTSSLEGGVATVGSVSIACLSCHDGTQAMDTVLNEPGSGAVVASYNTGAWTGAGVGGVIPSSIANLGSDLTDDHPVGIQYGGGGVDTTTLTGPTKNADFREPSNSNINGTRVWWVDTEGDPTNWTPNGTREKTDMQLYTRDVAAIGPNPQPFVECASCHDPHSSTNSTFLRISNTGSAVCLSCHTK